MTRDGSVSGYRGLILSSPAPILSQKALIEQFHSAVFLASLPGASATPFRLPAAQGEREFLAPPLVELSLLPGDALAEEQFCVIFTKDLALVMVLGTNAAGAPAFQFSFDPGLVRQAWLQLRSRLHLAKEDYLPNLEALVEQFAPPIPDYRLVSEFGRQLLKRLVRATGGGN
ncbi:MAG: hypothetical protein HC890_00055 [Chloroflexaceae bacterium]|nr:hypothetical protein [Chloroflexaceae bacterium]